MIRLGLALVASVLTIAVAAPVASAEIKIFQGDSTKVADTVTKGFCRVTGKKGNQDFFLSAKSDQKKFLLSVFIDAPVFRGFNDFYLAFYGGGDPQIFLHRYADDEVFSNFKLPGTPAGAVGGGGVAFRNDGKRVGIGLDPAVNKGTTDGYSFAGVINCKYKKKKKG